MSTCQQCIIKQFNALRALGKDDLIRISGCKTSKYITKGEVLFREGESINGVYCIKDGICKLTKLSANGKDQIVKLVVTGDLLGQRSLVSDEKSNLTAIAVNDMEVCFIPKREILHDLTRNASFSLDMLQEMAKELRIADNIIVDMAQKSVRQRLADLLLYLHTTFDVDEGGFLSVILSREDYANLVGTATESAIRILSQFKKEGLISTTGKQIKVVDFDGLKRVE
ncbi:Crp/Fnr family transcriptional regulator [Winogradskyella sp. SM1960]|uniref:Crp/Fnr family transcriptional regulator n=1 Tax=Winogradskyella sp. SM1960 TaxID=2865955 RepID=UPI001CD5F78E|nr:Crp/Fnr family transcriptional regulator [Winogradskyella sp. SM1960]